MKSNVKLYRLVFIILALAIGIGVWNGYAYYKQEKFYRSIKSKEITVKPKEITHKESDIFTQDYQKETDEQLKQWKKDQEITRPLIAKNAYGTYTTSIYYYAKTDTPSYVVCEIEAEDTAKIKHTLIADEKEKFVQEHEYQIIGLADGKKNKVSMIFYNEDDRAFAKTYFYIEMPEDEELPKIEAEMIGNSKVKMSDGLFALLGHDKSDAANIYLYDNEGASRGRMPLDEYRTDRFLFIGDQMVYSYDLNKIAFINRLGRVVKTMDIGQYEFHHDFLYDKKADKILCLVNDTKADTIEDVLISVDMKTGKVQKLINFQNLLPEMRQRAVQREGGKNTYGGTELDWLHLNSLDIIEDGSIIVSSREQSALIKVKDIYLAPKIDYIIHSGSIYQDTEYKDLLLKQKGDFVGQAGQHTITVQKDKSLKEGQYYLYMFNNNFGNAATIPSFDWSLYKGVGSFSKGEASYYYKYLVDENKRTFELVKKFELPYSSIVSSVQHLGGNVPFSSGMSKCFGEYDSNGILIKYFKYEADKYSYRVMKYNFKGFYYR